MTFNFWACRSWVLALSTAGISFIPLPVIASPSGQAAIILAKCQKAPDCAKCISEFNITVDESCQRKKTGNPSSGNLNQAIADFTACRHENHFVFPSDFNICTVTTDGLKASPPTSEPPESGSPPASPNPKAPARPATGLKVNKSKTTTSPAPGGAVNHNDSGATADRQVCDGLLEKAESCCNNPSSCLTAAERAQLSRIEDSMNSMSASMEQQQSGSTQGLRDQCIQGNTLGGQSSTINNIYQRACSRAQITCINSCRGLTDVIDGCNRLTAQATSYSAQGGIGGAMGLMGNNCDSLSNALPQNFGGAANDPYNQQANNPNDPYGCQTNPGNPACIQCTNDPSHPLCKGLTDNKMTEGQAGFGGPESTRSASDFNVGSMADAGGLNDGFTGSGLQAASAAALPTKTIPNNSGGGLPGDGGGSPARLDTPSRGGRGVGRPTVNTDIEQGFRSGGGGGFSYASGANTGPDGGEAHQGRGGGGGRGPASDDGGMTGLDLRKYLPGGDLDPERRAGGLRPASREINGSGVDIFERINRRMQEKCRLGLLLGCE
jgi:hypothetical protein